MTGFEMFTTARNLREGIIKDKYHPSLYGVGFVGEGSYRAHEQGKATLVRRVWQGMLARCYATKNPDYIRYGGRGVIVCEEWHNFQNFAEWYCKQKYYGKNFELDKDLVSPNSKVYSKETCVLVPRRINSLLIACNEIRGIFPVGVSKNGNGYRAEVCKEGRALYLGSYSTPEDAFAVYRKAKEDHIKEVAEEEFKVGNICERLYNSLMDWKVIPFPE